MKRYRIEILGENFLLNLDGDLGKFRFRTTRVVKANSSEYASKKALIQIHHELNQATHIVKNTPDVPRIKIESISELKFFQRVRKKHRSGFQFICDENPTAECV